MKKIVVFSIVLAILVPAMLFSGGKKDNRTVITFWKGPFSDNEADLWKSTIAKFEKENPDIKVEFLATPWETWLEKYTSAFASGSPPDVSFMNEWYPQFAEANQLVDLTPRVNSTLRAQYSKEDWDYCTYNGKVLGIPFTLGVSVVFYHKDAFRREGITQIPQDWESFREVCKKLTHGDQWALKFVSVPDLNIHQYMPFVIQSGATYFNENNTASGFNNPEGIRGIQYITDLIVKDKVAPSLELYSDDQLDDMFARGKIVMTLTGIEEYADIMENNPDQEIGAFLWPKGPAADPIAARANYGALSLLSISQASKHKEEAWRFIEFLTKPENEQIYTKAVNMLSPNPETNGLMYRNNAIMDTASEAAKTYINYPLHRNWGEIDTILEEMLEKIIRGAATAERAVQEADAKIIEALKH